MPNFFMPCFNWYPFSISRNSSSPTQSPTGSTMWIFYSNPRSRFFSRFFAPMSALLRSVGIGATDRILSHSLRCAHFFRISKNLSWTGPSFSPPSSHHIHLFQKNMTGASLALTYVAPDAGWHTARQDFSSHVHQPPHNAPVLGVMEFSCRT